MAHAQNRPKQINFQVDDELDADIKIVARRRGQTVSEFLRLTVKAELEREAVRHITNVDPNDYDYKYELW